MLLKSRLYYGCFTAHLPFSFHTLLLKPWLGHAQVVTYAHHESSPSSHHHNALCNLHEFRNYFHPSPIPGLTLRTKKDGDQQCHYIADR